MTTLSISPQELYERVKAGRRVDLIDVRTPAEFREVHVEFARNIPLDQFDAPTIALAHGASDEPLYVICRSGNRARQAFDKLQQAGLTRVVNVEGGTQAWDQAGFPVTRGQKTISLERQVRIAAGLLVLAGVILGWLVHPAALALSAFIGAGLVFSGITDTCGMGLILARMPWNRVRSESTHVHNKGATPGPQSSTRCCG